MSSNTDSRIVLASQSPQRRAILEQLGLRFEVIPSGVEELTTGDPAEVVVQNAYRKASDVLARVADPQAVVIGADTEVVSGGTVLGKP
ncbi:MAG: Maf family protein, partial [Thermoleophilaceae bacterium]|nr:Maf family protein [Thermoleophilaceae bacterium]